jgi:hypothetical protein
MTDQQQTADVETATQTFKKRFRSFVLPRRILIDDNLKRLSHDALRTYLFLGHKSYRQLDRDFLLGSWEISRATGVPHDALPAVKMELKRAKLIDFRDVSKAVSMFMLVRDLNPWEATYEFSGVQETQPSVTDAERD